MDIPRDRFVKMMDDFDRTHDYWLRRIMFFFGRRLKKMNNPVGRFIVSKITTQFSAYMIVEKHLFGVDKTQNETVQDIALNWRSILGLVDKYQVVPSGTTCSTTGVWGHLDTLPSGMGWYSVFC